MAPGDKFGLKSALKISRQLDGPSIIRYPRDNVPATVLSPEEWTLGKGTVLREGTDAIILNYGALLENALKAADDLASKGYSVGVYDMRFCKPIDKDLLAHACESANRVFTLEDHSTQGGFGSAAMEAAPGKSIVRLGLPDRLIEHASRSQQLTEVLLDPHGLSLQIEEALKNTALQSVSSH
jgi:1-deoxy-D-xylulose-5-phosphate synthase